MPTIKSIPYDVAGRLIFVSNQAQPDILRNLITISLSQPPRLVQD
jgi:hypothetical protein